MKLRRVDNPPNPYLTQHAEWLEPPPIARLEVYEEQAQSILTRNDSPDLPFTWSVNPYRGCQHACIYCYARPYHEYLGYGAGSDFETKLVAKVNAPELLRAEFSKRSWQKDWVNFSGITDCYQPLEACYEITRRCLEVCLEFRNPAAIVTKGYLVVRDAELLSELARKAGAAVYVSIPFAEDSTAKLIEPQATAPSRRFEAVAKLTQARVPVGVMVAPIIPGLNDQEVPQILHRAAQAGARNASFTALRLSGSVKPVFIERLREAMPLRAERVLAGIRAIRGGKLNDTRFGQRMRGQGPRWESIREMFQMFRKRYGLDRSMSYDVEPDIPILWDRASQLEKPFIQLTLPLSETPDR